MYEIRIFSKLSVELMNENPSKPCSLWQLEINDDKFPFNALVSPSHEYISPVRSAIHICCWLGCLSEFIGVLNPSR